MHAVRLGRVRERMAALDVDVLLLVGADLPWLTGYEAMPLERLTMLVVPRDADATLVVPRLEAPRVVERPDVFTVRAWDETDDPVAIMTGGAAADGRRFSGGFSGSMPERSPDFDVGLGVGAVRNDRRPFLRRFLLSCHTDRRQNRRRRRPGPVSLRSALSGSRLGSRVRAWCRWFRG